MRRSSHCLYCGHTPLVRWAHWHLCPFCSKSFLASLAPPSLAEQMQAAVGGLLQDVGRPTRDGRST